MTPIKDLRRDALLSVGTANLVGREAVLRRDAVRALIRGAVQKGSEVWNVIRAVPGGAGPEEAALLPVGGGRRVVVVEGVDPAPFVAMRAPTTLLVCADGQMRDADLDVDCRTMFGARLRAWIRARARELGADLDADDVEALAGAFGGDAGAVEGQLVRLSLLDHAEGRHVQEACRGHRSAGVRDAVDAAVAGRAGDAADLMHGAVLAGVPAAAVVAAMRRRFHLLARVKAGAGSGALTDAEAAVVAAQETKCDWARLMGMVADLAELELRIRRGTAGTEDAVAAVYRAASAE